MFTRLKASATYANVASTTALILVIGGGGAAVAANLVPANSVASRQIVNNSVKSADIKNNRVTGADVKESTLAKVPRAVRADRLRSGAITSPNVFAAGQLGVVRAYAWNSSAGADANLTDSDYTYNRSGGEVTVVHNGAGDYTINFAGLDLGGGNVVVSSYGGDATSCKVNGWGSNSVGVLCFDSAGVAADSPWTIAVAE
jgi:hypothetical protein